LNIFISVLGGITALLVIAFFILRISIRLGGRKVVAVDVSTWVIKPRVKAEVIRQPDDSLIIRWEQDADSVDIYASIDPDEFSSGDHVTKVNGQSEIVLPGFHRRKRYYFRLQFSGGEMRCQDLVVAERFLPVESVINLRDIGGYQTEDGCTVRWGKVFRTGNLSRLNDEDMAYLEGMNIRQVCDLRSTSRTKAMPDRIPPGVGYLHTPIYEDEFTKEMFPKLLFQRHLLGDTLGNGYWNWPESGASAYGKLFEQFADSSNYPLMFHCTAGKDRAGIGAAILFSLLGVPEETIIADYSLTNLIFDQLYQEFLEIDRVDRLGIPPDEMKIMLAANPDWIQRTLAFIRNEYGGAAPYLREAAGLPQSSIDTIRDNLLIE
jgi:protein-tyrosine phosphatase